MRDRVFKTGLGAFAGSRERRRIGPSSSRVPAKRASFIFQRRSASFFSATSCRRLDGDYPHPVISANFFFLPPLSLLADLAQGHWEISSGLLIYSVDVHSSAASQWHLPIVRVFSLSRAGERSLLLRSDLTGTRLFLFLYFLLRALARDEFRCDFNACSIYGGLVLVNGGDRLRTHTVRFF